MIFLKACYLPISPDGIPLMGKIPGFENVYIATGHSCWGILNSPATGAAMAELIVDGHCKLLDLSPFDPIRFQKKKKGW
jgi:glycine/D-amino acid oxidase-like deaminating enzyme